MRPSNRLVFASHNRNKTAEVNALLGPEIILSDLTEAGFREEIPEPHPTLEENAMAKARFVAARCGANCFADDTGLEVDALHGLPGVLSARYAGEEKDPVANMEKLLREMAGQNNRSARFRTVIALIINGEEHLFEGIARGKIAHQPKGSHGFGYDPVFVPEGYTKTFAELALSEKNRISHRQQAISQLAAFLNNRSSSP